MNCPTCNVSLTMAERSGIEIDYCPKCRGVWLDRGELDKIIERAGGAANSNTPNTQAPMSERGRNHDDDDDRGRFNRNMNGNQQRENPIMELFDFF